MSEEINEENTQGSWKPPYSANDATTDGSNIGGIGQKKITTEPDGDTPIINAE